MAKLDIHLLGPALIEVDGAQLEVDTRKAVALLAILAVTGRPYSRDVLAELLWPESDPESGRAALRRTLSVLKKGLGDRWVTARRESVALDPGGVEVDVLRFRALLRDGRVSEAVDLARGDFMEGFALRDSAAFDDWQLSEAQALRRELSAGLERLAEEEADRGDRVAAIQHARRRLALDLLSESAHRQLIQLYALNGDRAAALEQYRECVRTLHRELGVAPVEETTALYEAISEGRLTAPAADLPVAAPVGRDLYPLVGREAELRKLFAVWGDMRDDGRLLAIEGEAGIGKTRLAQELVDAAESGGAEVLVVRAREGEKELPYGVIAETLRLAAAKPRAADRLLDVSPRAVAEAARLAPELGELTGAVRTPSPIEGVGAQERFVAGLAEVVSACCAARRRGLLFVDDAQWADVPSLEALAYLTRRLEGRPLCIVLAWRTEDVESGDPLRQMTDDARRLGIGTVLSLGRLEPDAVAELATVAGFSQAAARVSAETAGLPLFVVEYLAALGRGEEESPPASVVELLRARAAAVGELSKQVLTAAAVLGSFDFDVVRDTSGRSDDETVTALEELILRALVVESEEGYRFVHDKLRDVVYADTSLARRRLLHRRAAETLAAQIRRDQGPRAGLVAEHFRLAGRDAEAAEYHLLAGEHARSLFANAEAISHFESALALGHPDQAGLNEAIGELETLQGDYGRAVQSLEAAAALTAADTDLARIEHKLGGVHQRRGDWEVAASRLEAAVRAAHDDPALSARIEADRSLNEHRRGNREQALEHARAALRLAEAAGDPASLAQTHNLLGILASSHGDLAEARRELQTSLEAAERLGDPGARIAALNNLALVARAEGDFERALELTEAALDLCIAQGDRHREAALQNNLADLLHEAGCPEEAMAHLKQAVAIFADVGADAGEMQAEIWKLVEW